MIRIASLSVVALMGLLFAAVPADAQVFIRAPFVQVETGQGVYVRAPFVRLYIPNNPPTYMVRPGPGVQIVPAPAAPPIFVPGNPPAVMPPAAEAPAPNLPQPQMVQPNIAPTPPQPIFQDKVQPPQPLEVRYPTLDEFARNFQAKAGQYDVTVINPVTQQPTQLKFTLPEGAPRRVIVDRDEIEFRYSLRQFVRIQFTNSGVVTTIR
jgi:hypothetical protein